MATSQQAGDRFVSPEIAEAHRRRSRQARGLAALAGSLAFALAPAVLAGEWEKSAPEAGGRPACADLPPGHPPVACEGIPGLPPGHPPVVLMPGLPPGHPPVALSPDSSCRSAELPPGHPQVQGERTLPPGHPPVGRFPPEVPIFDEDAPQTL